MSTLAALFSELPSHLSVHSFSNSNERVKRSLAGKWMKTKLPVRQLILAIGYLLAAAGPVRAHHSRAMFDVSKNVTYEGIVKEYRWENPHCHIVIAVESGANNQPAAGIWSIEASSVNLMVGMGWTRTSYKPGDPITLVAHPMRDGSKGALLFYAIRPDGTRLYRAEHRYTGEKE